MTHLTLSLRRPPVARLRPFRLAGLALALAGALGMAACQRGETGLGGRNAELALETLKAAPEHGFRADRFKADEIERLLKAGGRDRAEGARRLQVALVDYSRAQHGLTIPASAFPKEWGLKPAKYDAEASLAQAMKEGKLEDWLKAQPPASPNYQVLQKAYLAYLKIHTDGGWPQVAAAPLQLGAQGPHVIALRQRLAFEDKALGEIAPETPVDPALIAALQRFQAAHGLKPTGQLDAETLQAINVPALSRAAQIRANMERLRWLSREDIPTRIDVNIAAAVMDYFVDGQRSVHMLAVSGRPGGDETPMLASKIENIVLNPPWNVPEGIAQEEIIPKGEAYLRSQNFVFKDGRLVQQPGPQAALGLVKFDFDNPYAVYLHDTPAKAAFSQTQRAVSHGCVRLAQAVPLAITILSQQSGWSQQRVNEVLASGETTHVKLSKPVPVRLLYFTAFPEGERIHFRPDIYGWDAKLLQMLDNPPPAPKPGTRT